MYFAMRAAMPSFRRGHVEAFRYFGACPRVILYDNVKSAVLEREGDAVRFHPTLLALAGHYRFEPRACAPYRPNEKGRVERAIRDVRENFFAARDFTSIEDLNAQPMTGASRSRANDVFPTRRTRPWRRPFSRSSRASSRSLPMTFPSRSGSKFAQERHRTFASTERL